MNLISFFDMASKHVNSTPKIISKAQLNDWDFVFLINNPVTAIVSKMIIEAYGIPQENVVAVSVRKTDTSLIDKYAIDLGVRWSDRILIKLLSDFPVSRRVLRPLNRKKKKFILFTAWAYGESSSTPCVARLLSSQYCQDLCYIEEGQQAYRDINIGPNKNKKKAYLDDEDRLNHREIYKFDSPAFFGILPEAFPLIPKNKRFILSNYDDIKKNYRPLLKGVKIIALTCAERRLQTNQWEAMLQKLVDMMPDGGVIKLHPSLSFNHDKRRKIELILTKIAAHSIQLCPDDAIIELEMLHEKKTLLGPLTSLKKYAEAFGSTFQDVELY